MSETECMQLDPNGLEILDRVECIDLLTHQSIARLGLSMDALPIIIPVNYVVDGDQIVIRTGAGSKLDAALARAVVAVEVDDYDPMSHTGWSVLVRGTSWLIDDAAEVERESHLRVRPWANDAADRWIGVSIDMISGRRIRSAYEPHHAGGALHGHRS